MINGRASDHEQLFVDSCAKTFVVSNVEVDSADFSSLRKHLSRNEIVVRQFRFSRSSEYMHLSVPVLSASLPVDYSLFFGASGAHQSLPEDFLSNTMPQFDQIKKAMRIYR
jgi:hypothetical protein